MEECASVRHGANVKRCRSEGCIKMAQKGGACIKHEASWTRKKHSSEGWTNQVTSGGVSVNQGFCVEGRVCRIHGAELKQCSSEGCTNRAKHGGVCWMHRPTRTHTMDLLLLDQKLLRLWIYSMSALLVLQLQTKNVPPYCYLSQRSCDLYTAVIASAKNSKSIHKQGLACESAGFTMKDGRCTKRIGLLSTGSCVLHLWRL